jgi:hypothetical protein
VEFAKNLENLRVIRNIKAMDSTIKMLQNLIQTEIQDSKNHTLIKDSKDIIHSMETQKDMKKILISMSEDLIKTNIQTNKTDSIKLHKQNIIKIINIRIIKNTNKTKMMMIIMLLQELNFKKDPIIMDQM